LENLLQ